MRAGAVLAEGFALGLSTGPSCLASCGVLLGPFLLAGGRPWRGCLKAFAEFLLGRLAAYACVGFAAGALGAALEGGAPPWLTSGAVLASGLLLLGTSVASLWSDRFSWCSRVLASRASRRAPMLLGVLTGLNICPPFAAGLVCALDLGGAWAGAAFFCAFFAGTSLFLLPILGAAPLAAFRRAQTAGAVACAAAGVWMAAAGAMGLRP